MRVLDLLFVAALVAAGTACAQVAPPGGPAPRERVMTLAEVELDCVLLEDRRVKDCAIVKENPVGAGRIAIERKLGPKYRVPESIVGTGQNGRIRLVVPFPLVPAPQ